MEVLVNTPLRGGLGSRSLIARPLCYTFEPLAHTGTILLHVNTPLRSGLVSRSLVSGPFFTLEYPLAERPGQPLARSRTLFTCLSNFAVTGSILFGAFLCRCRVVYAEQCFSLFDPYI